jgi:hypothetical protein
MTRALLVRSFVSQRFQRPAHIGDPPSQSKVEQPDELTPRQRGCDPAGETRCCGSPVTQGSIVVALELRVQVF